MTDVAWDVGFASLGTFSRTISTVHRMSYPPQMYDGKDGEVSAHMVRAGIEPAVVPQRLQGVLPRAGHRDGWHVRPLPLEFEGLAEGIGDFDEDAYAAFMREHDNHWL